MDKENRISNQDSNTPKSNRVKRIKTCIVIIALVLLILPTIMCIFMFFKLNSLQKQIDILMIDRYGVTYSSKSHTNNEGIAYAATVDNSRLNSDGKQSINQYADDKNQGGKDTIPSIEENTKKEYNNVGSDIEKEKSDIEVFKDVSTAEEDINTKEDINTVKDTVTKKDTGIKKDTSTKKDTGTKKDVSADSSKQIKSDKEEYKDFDKKEVYLTFDDGPSKYTEDIIKILSDYNVKATFFVIGKTDSYSKKMYKKIVEEGHTLGMHSYSHDYNKIYKSVEDFDKDFTKLRDLLYDTTGYISSIYRFPGGSSNNVMKEDVSVFINYLNQKSVVYFDWNVVSGDATGVDYTVKELYDNVINGIKLHSRSIVLMHDTDKKENTLKSLKQILKTLTEQGVTILPLNENVTPIQQVKKSSLEQIK